MTPDVPPVVAYAQFFDDIRVEITGKPILIGQYVGTLISMPGAPSVDRLAILLAARWPRDYMPSKIGVKVDVPGQPTITQAMAPPPAPDFSSKPISPFSGITTQAIIQLRFPPLRAGDIIDVWFEADDHPFPAGRLYVTDQLGAGVGFTFGAGAILPSFAT
jgi:hypothetical protein